MKPVFKVLGIIALVAIFIWGGITVAYWAGWLKTDSGGSPKLPAVEQAQYAVTIKNTGGLYFTSQYPEVRGTQPGQRVFILYDCYQTQGSKYVLIKTPPPLDERVFGIITVEKRK